MLCHKKSVCFLTALLTVMSMAACAAEIPNESARTMANVGDTVLAEVILPNASRADVLFAEYMVFDEHRWLEFFFGDQIPVREEQPEFNAVIYQNPISYFVIRDDYLSYLSKEVTQRRFPIENLEAYTQENLDFMSRVEAEAAVREVLTQLSIDTSDYVEVYAIDSVTMQRQQEEMLKEYPAGAHTKEVFAPEDDFYIMYFTTMQNQIPVTRQSYEIMAGERTLLGSDIRVSFSSKGIIEFYCSGIYQVQGVAYSPETYITVAEALEHAYKIHTSILSSEKITVTAIDFAYVPIPYNDHYNEVKLTPAWILTLTGTYATLADAKTGASENNMDSRILMIDAISGKEIVTVQP